MPVQRPKTISQWKQLQADIIACERCPRLRAHCTRMATEKRAAFRDQTYWGRPVPGMGAPDARLLIVGLAPAAHGANRTGRVFTGDRSGDFLFRALYETGFANQPTSEHPADGLELIDAAISGVARCAPPENKPTPAEIENCSPFLQRTLDLMQDLRVIVALGKIAFDQCIRMYAARAWLPTEARRGRPKFAHGAVYGFDAAPFLLATFHPSQQNTFTGRLTPAMMRDVFRNARNLIDELDPRRTRSTKDTKGHEERRRKGERLFSHEWHE